MEVIDQRQDSSKDPELLELAKKRVAFKKHLMTYLIVIMFLWLIWLLNGLGHPWPIWPMIGWGIAIFIQYMNSYQNGTLFSVNEEYKELEKRKSK